MAATDSYAGGDGRLSPLSTPSATRAVLEAHGIGTKYTLGQNFLVNDDVLKKIIALAEVDEADRVLEVGPGIGTLTIALLKHAASVVLDYFESFLFLDSATIMVQKEVADRMAAAVGTKNYGAYTVKLGLHAEPAGRFPVGPGNFFPPPRVDSAVIRLNRRVPLMADGAPATPEVIAAAALIADAAFANRRKTIANSCKTYFSGRGSLLLGASGSSAGLRAVDGALSGGVGGAFVLDGADIVDHLPAILDAAAIDPRRRGETLTQQEFLALGAALLKEATV